MKKALFVAFMTIWSIGNSQTTIQEYTYVTKGMKIQIETGQDLNSGYTRNKVGTASGNARNVELWQIKKKGILTSQNLVYWKDGGDKEYLCVPHPKSEQKIFDLYWTGLYGNIGDSSYRLQIISYVLSRYLTWS